MTKLTDDLQANVALFIEETQLTDVVWGLKNETDGWLACDSTEFEKSEVMPFWSHKADAQQHNLEEWADFEVAEISLDDFVEEWLVSLAEDGVLLGINWNSKLEGKELEPSELAKMYLK